PGLVRDGAARGDELRVSGRGQPDQRLPARHGGRPPGISRPSGRFGGTPRGRPRTSARRPRPAPADGRRGPAHRARDVRLAARGGPARGLLRRPPGRPATSMGKREVITRFVILAILWLVGAAAISKVVGGVAGDAVEGVAVLVLL